EAADHDFSADLKFPSLQNKVDVYFDERLVPHIFADDVNDAYFVQGFLHAKFRLFQMELQTMAADGRAAEWVGLVAVTHDREFRRLGMHYAAENSLAEMESDPVVKSACDNYTAGVNAYIASLTASRLPVEYKLLNVQPEKWTNLKTALFLKYMSQNLAGYEEDFEMTNSKNFFSPADFKLLYPDQQDSVDPIIPKGTLYATPAINIKAPFGFAAAADSIKPRIKTASKPDPNNGSNNWAVNGTKTATGAPILCNDPHLGLNLPSLWYEMQISTPTQNTYGVSFPGAPSIIIGYNDSIAWGVTNGGRDVRDYFEITFKDDTRREYWFDSAWVKADMRVEKFKVKDSVDFVDTVAYTVFGPVMYDKNFGGKRNNKKSYAVTWTAHRAGKELLTFMLLDKAKNYNDYLSAVGYMHTPGQNFVFAAKSGDIAMRTQGDWPAKWKGQGDYVMPGTDSSYMWQAMIPANETPFQYNPERGFVSSANQRPADSTYPYYFGKRYPVIRGVLINKMLTKAQQLRPADMMKMQTDNYNLMAEWAMPLLLKNVQYQNLSTEGKTLFNELKSWNLINDIHSRGATIFEHAWKALYEAVYSDELAQVENAALPFSNTLLESLLRDSTYKFIDDRTTPAIETLPMIATLAFEKATSALSELKANNKMEWGKFKNTRVKHLLKLDALSRLHLPIGGGENMINATKEEHGPSWRMIVSLTQKTEAYGVYPGGQSGNPGSRFYDTFVDSWANGTYYPLWMMSREEVGAPAVKWKMTFRKS
ncbi:MAG: penicillin acylase family protein, partial [Ferruginibacter sp.]